MPAKIENFTRTLKEGDKAPDFTLPGVERGAQITLSLYEVLKKGKKVVLLWHPLDWTPVCSKEIPMFNDRLKEFEEAGATIIDASVDTVASHKAWTENAGVEYPSISDFWPHGDVAKKYGIFIDDKGISERAIFVIDIDGAINAIRVYPIGELPNPDDILPLIKK
ncbi:MAG: redoxin domain-containing protein [Candidatus Hermodarchaeota archaeon]